MTIFFKKSFRVSSKVGCQQSISSPGSKSKWTCLVSYCCFRRLYSLGMRVSLYVGLCLRFVKS